MILRPVNGEIKESCMLSKEVIAMSEISRIVNNDFECQQDDGETVKPQ